MASPLAARPYDLRHAAVDVLLRVYAKGIDGDEEIANQRIGQALAI